MQKYDFFSEKAKNLCIFLLHFCKWGDFQEVLCCHSIIKQPLSIYQAAPKHLPVSL